MTTAGALTDKYCLGFAAKNEKGELLVKTISDTEIAAMINWLVTEAKVTAWYDWSDEKVTGTFSAYAFPRRVSIVPVQITEASHD